MDDINNTGTEWILHLLDGCSNDERLPVIMPLWRNWHVRNEIYHEKPAPPVEASQRFLSSYIDILLGLQQHPEADITKGKMVISYDHSRSKGKREVTVASCTRPPEQWSKPPEGWVKLNVDGAWREADGTGGAGMILRDHVGAVIFASCRFLPRCASPLEAELSACM